MLKKCLLLCFLVFLLVNCSGVMEEGSPKAKSETSTTGTISLVIDTQSNTRSIPASAVKYYDIRIKAMGMTPIEENGIAVSDISSRIYTIDAVNNVAVLVIPLDIDKNPVGIGVLFGGYGDVAVGQRTSIKVNSLYTPMARILENLIASSFAVDTYDPAPLQAAIENELTVNGLNPLAIDIAAIQGNIELDATYAQVDTFTTASITGRIVNPGGYVGGVTVSINDPSIAPVVSDATGDFTFINVASGIWTITLGIGGTAQVSVGIDGTYMPDPLTVTAGVNTPIIYDYGISTFTDNDVQKTIVAVQANDIDGIADVANVSIEMPTGHTPATYSLSDVGGSVFYDTSADDGVFEVIADEAFVNDTYTITVSDYASNITTTTYDAQLTYIDSPVIMTITDGEVLDTTVPSIAWGPVTGANYYNIVIKSGVTEVYKATNVTATSYQVLTDLPEGNFTLDLYAYTTGSGYEKSVSLRSIDFSVSLSSPQGTVDLEVSLGKSHTLYYAYQKEIRKLNMDTGEYTVIYTGIDDVKVCSVSPDGLNILFVDEGSLYRMDVSGANPFLLVSKTADNDTQYINEAKWSPDGQKIICRKYRNLYVLNADGTNRVKFPLDVERYQISNDSTRIYHVDYNNIYSNNFAGTDAQLIVGPVSSEIELIKLSPDGKRLLYGNYQGETNYYYTINTDGTENSLVYQGVYYFYPQGVWTMDNRLVLHKLDETIVVVDGDIVTEYTIPTPGSTVYDFMVAPDNSAIIISDNYSNISSIGLDGSNPHNIIENGWDSVNNFDISPLVW